MKQWQLQKIREYINQNYWDYYDKECPDTREFSADELWEMLEWIREDLRQFELIRNME